jgi:hypothetical protein
MSDVRVWLVGRDIDSRDLVTLTYATEDGERTYERTMALAVLDDGVRAGRDVPESELAPAPEDEVGRYAEQARRTAEDHDPDDRL